MKLLYYVNYNTKQIEVVEHTETTVFDYMLKHPSGEMKFISIESIKSSKNKLYFPTYFLAKECLEEHLLSEIEDNIKIIRKLKDEPT